MRFHFAKGASFVLPLALAATSASAQYTAKLLPLPSGDFSNTCLAASSGQQVGASNYGYPAATLWNGLDGMAVNLDLSVWLYGSVANSSFQGRQGGAGYPEKYTTSGSGKGGGGSRTYFIPHAVLWKGSARSAVDLHPAGMYESMVTGIGNGVEVGWATTALYGQIHAELWKDTAASAVQLDPSGFTGAEATAVDSNEQVGYGTTSSYSVHALLWHGTASSAKDLHPSFLGAYASYAYALDASRGEQVGCIDLGVGGAPNLHACLWNGTAASVTDLNPSGFSESQAVAVRGGLVAGFGLNSSYRDHALVWTGSASSAIDLHQFLPSTLLVSEAHGIDPDGTIVGTASDYTGQYAVIWTPTAQSYLAASQDVSPGPSGWSTQNVNLHLTSPFTSTKSLVYSINGAPQVTVSGQSCTLPFTTTGSYVVSASAVSSTGRITPNRLYTVNVDETPPKTTSAFKSFILTLEGSDTGSGVEVTNYVLDGGATASYTGPVSLSNINHSVVFWSTDRAGNVEGHHTTRLSAVAPTLTSISPATALSGSPAFTLVLKGAGFIQSSVVHWNGATLSTTYVNATQLEAAVPATDLATAGSVTVSVTNPAPGTGSSVNLTFAIPQTVTATGSASNINDPTSLDLRHVTSYSGFTLNGSSVHVTATSATEFLDSSGNNIGSSAFWDELEDGQALKVIGTYDSASNTITATSLQMQ